MTLHTERLPKEVMGDIRENMGVERDDTSLDRTINAMKRSTLFDKYLTWNGIIGYSANIR